METNDEMVVQIWEVIFMYKGKIVPFYLWHMFLQIQRYYVLLRKTLSIKDISTFPCDA